MIGRNTIANLTAPLAAPSVSGLSLIFRPGQRPAAADVLHLLNSDSDRTPAVAVSYQPAPGQGWLELLAGGLTFDLTGLDPALPAPMPAVAHWYGLPAGFAAPVEAITLLPGEQLLGDETLLPVVRIMVGIAARLAGLAHVMAVVWHPARSVLSPQGFVVAVDSWLNGGAFPALGLTALVGDEQNGVRSEGLSFFIGRELLVEGSAGMTTAQNAKMAVRIINKLIGIDAIHHALEFMGPNGEQLCVAPSADGGFLRVCRKT